MKRPFWQRLLGPLAPAAYLGLYFEGDTCFASVTVSTILGPREVDELAVPLAGRPPGERVGDIVRRVIARTGRLAGVIVGIPERECYLETRRLTPGSAPGTLKAMEPAAALGPPGAGPAKPVVQVVRRPDPHGGPGLHGVIACRDTVLERLESAVPHLDDYPVNLEPAALAALRVSLARHPAPGALSIRVLAGAKSCVGYLLHGPSPLLVTTAPSHEAGARPRHVLALITGLIHHARAYLELEVGDLTVEGLALAAAQHVQQQLGRPVQVLEGPGIDGQSVAAGLAFGACGMVPAAVHLHRHQMERRRAARAHFPWHDVAAVAAATVTMLFAMEVGARRLNQSIEAAQAAVSADGRDAGRPLAQLIAARDETAEFVTQWVDFDDRPLSWARALTALAQVLPDPVRLARVEGRNPPLPRTSPEPGPFTMNVVSPEKHLTLGAMLSEPYLKRAFPHVEVSMSVGTDPTGGGVLYTLIASGQAAVPDSTQERTGDGASR